MAVPTIPSAISATSIQTEFGGSNPIAINEYYAGGSYVPSGTANATSVSIPTSGQIAYSNFSGAAGELPVSILARYPSCTYFGKGSCNAYMRFFTNGTCEAYGSSNYTWLNSGTASTYDVRQTRTGGSYSTLSGMTNTVWYNMSTTRTGYLLSPALGGTRTYWGNVCMKYNANSTLIDCNVSQWYAFTDYTGGCPLCCFTPNTPITMADGSKKLIIDIEVGDEIKTYRGSKRVTEILVRENMHVYKIMFNDEFELDATDDHPMYVRDKGWSCIKPQYKYKDMGIPHQLEIGDFVVGENGEFEVTSIVEVWYPWKVYTFPETEFYANGILVY